MEMPDMEIDAEANLQDGQENSVLCTTLSEYVKQTVTNYLQQLGGHDAVNLYEMVMAEVEKPLLEAALEHLGHNQSKAAKALGLSRSTLRKKMDFYGLN